MNDISTEIKSMIDSIHEEDILRFLYEIVRDCYNDSVQENRQAS